MLACEKEVFQLSGIVLHVSFVARPSKLFADRQLADLGMPRSAAADVSPTWRGYGVVLGRELHGDLELRR